MFKHFLVIGSVVGLTLAVAVPPRIARAGDDCTYNGATYSDGAASCQAGKRYKCDDGEWKGKGERCTGDETSGTKERTIEKRMERDTEKTTD